MALALASYYVRMFVVTAAYHRYFSHRAFKTSRWFQFLLAVGAQSAAQNGVVWWAGHHRWHHKHSDKPEDVHSAKLRGFWYAHLGWIMRSDWNDTDERMVADLARFPELRWLNKPVVHILPTVAMAIGFAIIGYHQAGLPWGSIGYVNVPAALAITSMSILSAPRGVAAAHALPASPLRKVFGVYLLFIAVIMLRKSL